MKTVKNCKARALTALLILSLTVNACTSYQPIAGTTAESLAAQLESGDRIEITKTDGDVVQFAIDEIDAEGIAGDEIFVPYDEIAQVQVLQMDDDKVEDAAMIVLAAPLVILGVGLLVLLAAGTGGIPGP